jgi:hypothetical protein
MADDRRTHASDLQTVFLALDRVLPELPKCLPPVAQGACERPWMVTRRAIGMSPPEYRCDEHAPPDRNASWTDAPWAAAVRTATQVRAERL